MSPQTPSRINRCGQSHHFLGSRCDLCHQTPVDSYPARGGDCISCGALCPGNAYACDRPAPLAVTAADHIPEPRTARPAETGSA